MGLFGKKSDPLTKRARVLNDEIAALEAQIRRLDARVQRQSVQPRLRSTAVPNTTSLNQPLGDPVAAAVHEPIFEDVDLEKLRNGEPPATPEHFNELGVRKYDLPALFQRWRNHFRGPSTTNPKLVSYLAAGGIQGLRPMRYEKRVARNRFIAFVVTLLVVLLGCLVVIRHH
jgi:hypothetical protein